MATQTEGQIKLALLIDADNVSAKYLPIIMNEIPKYGVATYRRIYGDFTDNQMATWRPLLLKNAIQPIQQFSNVKSHKKGEKAGKNATDSTLIIDAMDILYAEKVDGFVIVSSDSDFTRLATRLRESNMLVVGMGRNQTSISFRQACTKFVNIEYLYKLDQGKEDENATRTKQKAEKEAHAHDVDVDADDVETTVTIGAVESVLAGVIRDNDNKGRATSLSEAGNALNNKFPDFDVRNFGYSQLYKMVGEMTRFVLVPTDNGYDVILANTDASTGPVAAFIVEQIGKTKNKQMSINSLSTAVYERFPDFSLKDAGYSQFYKFANSVDGVVVEGALRKQARLERTATKKG